MSEDPVKYEPLEGDTVKFGDIRQSPSWVGGVPRVELSPAAQIRIEALQAAAVVVAGTVDPQIQPQTRGEPIGVNQLVLEHAEQFAAWLEGK